MFLRSTVFKHRLHIMVTCCDIWEQHDFMMFADVCLWLDATHVNSALRVGDKSPYRRHKDVQSKIEHQFSFVEGHKSAHTVVTGETPIPSM